MKLIANKPIRYHGVRYTAGVEFEADEKWGDLLQRTGQARLAEDQAPARRRGRPPGSGKKVVEHQAVPPVTTTDITSDDLHTSDTDTDTQDDE
jgi:hypothetical protein